MLVWESGTNEDVPGGNIFGGTGRPHSPLMQLKGLTMIELAVRLTRWFYLHLMFINARQLLWLELEMHVTNLRYLYGVLLSSSTWNR